MYTNSSFLSLPMLQVTGILSAVPLCMFWLSIILHFLLILYQVVIPCFFLLSTLRNTLQTSSINSRLQWHRAKYLHKESCVNYCISFSSSYYLLPSVHTKHRNCHSYQSLEPTKAAVTKTFSFQFIFQHVKWHSIITTNI